MNNRYSPANHNGAAHIYMDERGHWFVSVSSPSGNFASRWFTNHQAAFQFASACSEPSPVETING